MRGRNVNVVGVGDSEMVERVFVISGAVLLRSGAGRRLPFSDRELTLGSMLSAPSAG